MKSFLRPFWHLAKNIFGFIQYLYAMVFQRPYFGTWMKANQCYKPRQAVMKKIAEQHFLDSGGVFNVLEIGAWAGVSTSIWGKVVRNGKVYVIDNWKTTPRAPWTMRWATKFDSIYRLFLHNIRTAGLKERIVILRGNSDDVLPSLKEKFDFIYIDGDHAYSQVRRDILSCLPLLKEGGIICGDDLELQAWQVDNITMDKHQEKDYIQDPTTHKYYHPGVTKAVKETLGAVEVEEGFWWKKV